MQNRVDRLKKDINNGVKKITGKDKTKSTSSSTDSDKDKGGSED